MQVCEGLFRYNYSSDMDPIPCLASGAGEWNIECTEFTVSLKEGVTFHDGSIFDAFSVKWVFDRIQYFTSGIWINGSLVKNLDDLPTNDLFYVAGQPILNNTEIIDNYQIRFYLNFPYVPFESLLANSACSIHLPDSNYNFGTKFFNLLDTDADLIGTGPFKLNEYVPDNEILFDYYPEYHLPWIRRHIERMIYIILPDPVTMSLATLNHELHWGYVVSDYYAQFAADPDLIDIQIKKTQVHFIQMNTKKIPFDVRQASQWCWNHSYAHTHIFNDSKFQLKVPIPDGMMYHRSNFPGNPLFNLDVARDYILNTADPGLSANVTLSGLNSNSTNTDWSDIADSTTPLAWYNFTSYNSSTTQLIALQLKDNLRNIGIRLSVLESIEWDTYKRDFIQNSTGFQKMGYSIGYWEPNLYDPVNMLDSLYQTNGENNAFLLSDLNFDTMLNLSYQVSDKKNREFLFELMQQYFVQNIVPSFYIAQEGDFIRYNINYVKEETIGDMLNPKGDHYWFKVGFNNFYEDILDLDLKTVYILSCTIAGFTGLIILFTFLENRIEESPYQCHICGKIRRKRKDEKFCPFCGAKKPQDKKMKREKDEK